MRTTRIRIHDASMRIYSFSGRLVALVNCEYESKLTYRVTGHSRRRATGQRNPSRCGMHGKTGLYDGKMALP